VRPVQAVLLSAVLLLLCGVIWWMTRIDGSTPRTAEPLSMEDLALSQPGDSPGDLQAPETLDREPAAQGTAGERAVVESAKPNDEAQASEAAREHAGRVLDHLGQAVEGAEVYFGANDSGFGSAIPLDVLYRSGSDWGEEVVRVETDALGRYSAETPKWNPARVAVRAPGHAPYTGELALPERGEDYADIHVDPTVFIEGRVFDHLGRAVEGARVESLPPRSNGMVVSLTGTSEDDEGAWRTDATGRFLIDQLAPGPYRLHVSHPDSPPEEVGGSTTDAGERVTGVEVHLGEGANIRGTVVGLPEGDDRKYVVVAQPSEMDFGSFAPMSGRTEQVASDGTFELRGLRKGTQVRLALYLDGDEHGFWGDGLAQEAKVMPGDQAVRLQFMGATSVSLRAVDAVTGEAVEDFELEAGGWWTEELSDENGKTIEHHPDGVAVHQGFNVRDGGSFDLVLRADGYDPLERKGLKVEPGERLDLGEVRLKAVPELTVKVVDDATGAEVKSARVKLQVQEDDEAGMQTPWAWNDEASEKTDERGTARLSSRPGRSVRFSVTHRHYADHISEPVVLPDTPDYVHEVRMKRGGTVEILVVDASGEPLAKRKVAHRTEGPTSDERFMHDASGRKSDKRGGVTFDNLPAGVHYFRIAEKQPDHGMMVSFSDAGVEASQLSDEWKPVTVIEGGEHALTLHAPPSAGLTGRLLENGRPLVGASLRLEKRREGDGTDMDEDEIVSAVSYGGFMGGGSGIKTDSEGRFEFEDESVGPVRLTIEHPLRAMPALYDLELDVGANEVEIDLDVTVLRGRVTDEDGKPVVSASVTVQRNEGTSSSRHSIMMVSMGGAAITAGVGMDEPFLTDSDGRFMLRGVAAGAELTVHVDAKDALLKDGSITVALLTPREERELDTLRLTRAGSLRVAVSAAGGASVAFCNVRLEPKEVDGDAETQFEFLQGSGEVHFTGLLPGAWTVVANSTDPSNGTDTSSEKQSVTIEAGEEARAELILR
jgi:protocatechuate 3,4-dioxygenase beta subunit